MITKNDIYRCYSVNLMQFMEKNQINYLLIAIDVVTGKKFWAYEKTENFKIILQKWVNNNPKKK